MFQQILKYSYIEAMLSRFVSNTESNEYIKYPVHGQTQLDLYHLLKRSVYLSQATRFGSYIEPFSG
jgi:hypothetical protein